MVLQRGPDLAHGGPGLVAHVTLGDSHQSPACAAEVFFASDIPDDLIRIRVTLTFVFHRHTPLAVSKIGLTHDAGTQFRAHVDVRRWQPSPLKRQPQSRFRCRVGADASLFQGQPRFTDARCPPVTVQHLLQVIHGAVRRSASLEFRPGNAEQMIGHHGDFVDVHLSGAVQPSPSAARDVHAIHRGDLVVEELSPMPDHAPAAGDPDGVRSRNVNTWLMAAWEEPRKPP